MPPDLSRDRLNITVLGMGQMGLVCAGLLGTPRHEGPRCRVIGWCHEAEEAGQLAQTRTSTRLEGFRLPPSVRLALKDAEAFDSPDLIVAAIPAQFIRSVFERLGERVPPGVPIVSVAKGIEVDTGLLPTQIIASVLGEGCGTQAALSGPTIASELARCLPATMVAASSDVELSRWIQRLFSTRWLRVYGHHDVLGVELAGAVKNVIAIAAGIIDGLSAGYNAKSALLARGLAEITRLGVAMGAEPETFFGIAGVGDLATTCFCPEGRNRSLGEALGRGENLDEYLARSPFVVEGVSTARAVAGLARRLGVDMPLTNTVHAVLFDKIDPLEGIDRLMSRELKDERVG